MSKAKQGDRVSVHYTGRLADGTVFDSSEGKEPIQFTVGAGEVIPGFEDAVKGMATGETRSTTIPADQAYGDRRPDMILRVDRSDLPPGLDPAEGDRLQMEQPGGQTMVVTVTASDPEAITLDANHPLAGEDLTFELELVGIEGE